jgi:hypothetical protein
MNVIVESRIIGSFLGFSPGIVHRLDDGSEWEQVGNNKEYVYRERPRCRIIFDNERLWIDVEGMNGLAEVRRYTGKRGQVHLRFDRIDLESQTDPHLLLVSRTDLA